MRHPCECCGHRTFPRPPGATWEICPVCGWLDTEPELVAGWNETDLASARRTYAAIGAITPEHVGLVRPPTPEEARPAWWLPVEAEAEQLIADFTTAFAGITLDGGVSLLEADRIDDYLLPSRDERSAPPPGFGRSPAWTALDEEALAECAWGPFVFMDARGLRFYTPAMAVFRLRHGRCPNSDEFLVGALGYAREACAALFTSAQRSVTARWMAWRIRAGEWSTSSALRALNAGWKDDLEPERRVLVLGDTTSPRA